MDINKQRLSQMHKLAMQTKSRAYCPYSGFSVGSTIYAGNGKYYTGCNVENPISSFCAQRTAIVKMVEDGCREILQVYVVTDLTGDMIGAPCGYCRQMIRQFVVDESKVLIHLGSSSKGYETTWTLSKILPLSFGPQSLGKTYAKDYKCN